MSRGTTSKSRRQGKRVLPAKPRVTINTRSAAAAPRKREKPTRAKERRTPMATKVSTTTAAAPATKLSPKYRPTEKERYMNPKQIEFFRQELLRRRAELLAESSQTLQHLQEETTPEADLADRATTETDRALELRTRDRERKLISKIDAALRRIEDGTYGYCEETGEPIGLKRLLARPIATLSIEAQERHERQERVYRDD